MGLSVSQIFSSAFAMLGQRFGSLLGLWATFFAIMIVVMLVFAGMMMGSVMAMAGSEMSEGVGAMGAGMILGMIVFYVGFLLITFAQSAALNHMASPLIQPSFGESLSAGARSSLTLLGMTLLLIVAYIVLAIPLALLFAAIGAASQGLAGVLALLLIPALVYLACRLVPITTVVAVDRVTNPITAITRTWALTRGKALPIFLVMVVFLIGVMVVYGILAWPLISASMAVASSGAPPDFGAVGLLSGIGILVAGIAASLLGATVVSAIHAGLTGQGGTETAETFS